MQLFIVTPFKKITKEIDWLDVQTTAGNFVILSEHAPMIVSLQPDSQCIVGLVTGKQDIIKMRHGMLHVTRESITILGDSAA